VKTLARYLEVIVDPTFDDFYGGRGSVRLAYLACVAIFHAVDRAADESGTRSAKLRQEWCNESLEFKLVDVIAHHLSMCRVPTKRSRQHALGYQSAVLSGSMKPAKAWT
jgi:hypothetical protein